MFKVRVIPCLDVKDGRVVKGVNFVDLRDAGDPVEQAAVYDAAGAAELTFLDIPASHENRDTILDVVSRTAARALLPLTVGGLPVFSQNESVTHDALHRVTEIKDLAADITYAYDANGNRAEVKSVYNQPGSSSQTEDYWYKVIQRRRPPCAAL